MKQNIKQILREGLILEQRIKFDLPIPSDIQQIKDVFKQNGFKLYVVGGAVRDALLGKTPKDYDLATDAVPDKVEEIMTKANFKTLPTGKAFGVINVFTSEGEYEIATFREDQYNAPKKLEMAINIDNLSMLDFLSYLKINNLVTDEFSDWYDNYFLKWEEGEFEEYDNWTDLAKDKIPVIFDGFIKNKTQNNGGRRPDAVSFTDIEGDVKRRDLTINALFYDIDTHEIVDLVGGVEDLKNGIVRTVGTPEDRFGEDRLRILRAIRFAGRFGNQLDPLTDAALQKDASLEGISGERIRDEFIKGIQSAKSQKSFFQMLDKYKLFDWIFKGLDVNREAFSNGDDYILLLARLLKNNNLDVLRKKLNELKYSAEEVKAIAFLIAMLKLDVDTAVTLKKAEQHAGVSPDQIKKFGKLEGVDPKLLDAFEKFRLTVSGPEVMDKMGLKPGPEVGKAIHKLETDNFKKLL